EGIRRMYEKQEDVFYYLTLMNENYAHPPMPQGDKIKEGILKGMYRFKAAEDGRSELRAHLFGSGAILNEALKAQKLLAEKYGVSADVWSVTSYKELYQDGNDVERWNMLHPAEKPRTPYITQSVAGADVVCVAAMDDVKAVPGSISQWPAGCLISLGTDGFGRSDNPAALGDFFEVDDRFISLAKLDALARERKIKTEVVN